MAHDHVPTAFVQALARALIDDDRVHGLWLEGRDASIHWPPFEPLDIHFAIPEPDVAAFCAGLEALFAACGETTDFQLGEAPLQGFAGIATLPDGTLLTYRVERMSQVGKVSRKEVNLLLDRTEGLLIPTLSFE